MIVILTINEEYKYTVNYKKYIFREYIYQRICNEIIIKYVLSSYIPVGHADKFYLQRRLYPLEKTEFMNTKEYYKYI